MVKGIESIEGLESMDQKPCGIERNLYSSNSRCRVCPSSEKTDVLFACYLIE
jgi:hypothetical protein